MIVTATASRTTGMTTANTRDASSSTSFEAQINSKKSQEVREESTTRTNEEIIAEYRAKRESEDFEAMLKNQVASYLATHEEAFREEYEFYDKYKEVFIPRYSNYTREKAEAIARELNAQFPDYKEMNRKAHYGGTEADKKAFEAMFIEYQAFNSYLHDKYDLDFGLGFPGFSPEGARAYNYAVYEQLEAGMSIEEATQYARGIAMTFGGREASGFQMMGLMGYPEDMEAAMATPESEKEIDYATQIDLRKYGIDHNFAFTNYEWIFGTDKEGIKQRIGYELELYTFLLEHENVVDASIKALAERSPEWFEWKNEHGSYAENLKAQFQHGYEIATLAQRIFDKYGDRIFQEDTEQQGASTEEMLSAKQTASNQRNRETVNPLEQVLAG